VSDTAQDEASLLVGQLISFTPAFLHFPHEGGRKVDENIFLKEQTPT